MPDGLNDYVFDPSTGQTIRLSPAFGSLIGLPRVESPLPELGADPTAYPGVEQYQEPTVQSTVMDAAQFAAEKQRREALPESVRNGTYNMDDNAAVSAPAIAQRQSGSTMGPRGRQNLTQATGPMGTVGQIGHDDISQIAGPQGQYATQADLDAYTRDQQLASPKPTDPGKPEEAGAGLQRQANQLESKVIDANTAIDQKAADAEVSALEDQQRRVDEVTAKTAREEAARQKRYDEINADVTKTTSDWADYKIDRSRRWKNASTGSKIAAAISIAMSALGDALQHKSGPNLALGIIQGAIEDDVNDQVAERQHLGEISTRTRSSLDDYHRKTGEWREAQQLKLAEEYKRTARDIELQTAKLKSPRAVAAGQAMQAQMLAKAGAYEQGVSTAHWQREMKQAEFAEQKRAARAGEGIAIAGQRQSDSHFNQDLAFKREELAANQKAAVEKYMATASAEQAKELREGGIKDPTTGQYILDNGKPVLGRDTTEAAKIQATVAGTQTMLSTIDRINAKIANEPGFAKMNPTQKQSALSAEFDTLTMLLKDAYSMGTLDKGLLEFTNEYTGGDPTKLTAAGLFGALGVGADAGDKTTARLDVIAKSAESRALNQLGNPKGYKFARDEKVQQSAANKAAEDIRTGTPTTAKAVEDVKPGWLTKNLQDLDSWLVPHQQKYKTDKNAALEGPGNSLKYPGFRVEKEPQLDTLVSYVKAGDPQAQKRLLEMVGDTKTPGLQDAAMTIVAAQAPELYDRALKELPADKRDIRRAVDLSRGPNIRLYPTSGAAAPVTSPSTYIPSMVPQAALDAARRTSDPLKSYLNEGD